jgi:lipopolysaccharide export system permease protein
MAKASAAQKTPFSFMSLLPAPLRLRIFDTYIARQVLSAVFTGVVVLTGVLVLGNIFKKLDQLLGSTSLPASAVAMFVLYIIPYSLIFTIPWAFLTGILLVFGRLSADNEMTALRMTGMSMPRICLPVFVMALALSGVCYWVNVDLAPFAKAKIKRLFYDVVVQNPAELFQAGKVFDQLPGTRIYTRKRDGAKLHNVEIYKTSAGFDESYTRADRAYVEYTPGTDEFTLRLEGALVEQRSKAEDVAMINDMKRIYLAKTYVTMSLQQLKEKIQHVNPSMKKTGELWGEIHTGLDCFTGGQMDKRAISSALTEVNMRYSLSLACITFALVGIPLGITAQRRETSIGFALSLVVATAYIVFVIFANTLNDKPGLYPHLLMWVPNVVFLAVGLNLFRKLARK